MNIVQLLEVFFEHEIAILHFLSMAVVISGSVVSLILMCFPATYGRYSSTGRIYSIAIPARLAWFIQELPSFLVPVVLIFSCEQQLSKMEFLILGCFIFHYFNRTFLYSFKIIGGKPTPIYAFALAFIYVSVNGYMQTRGIMLLSNITTNDYLRVGCGFGIFAIGFVVNLHSDHVLRNLRKPGEKGYQIPRGGMFEYVSCANYTGEMMEWLGYAIAAWSSVSFSFSFFTFANLVPRALHHHRFYITKFDDYPPERMAVIPFVL